MLFFGVVAQEWGGPGLSVDKDLLEQLMDGVRRVISGRDGV